MAITYRNRVTDRTVTMLEPPELVEELAKVVRRGKPLRPGKIRLAAKHRELTLARMDRSWKWANVDAAEPATPAKVAKAKSGAAKATAATGAA